MKTQSLPEIFAWAALATVCGGPFLFGAVDRDVWFPLCLLWIGLGFASALLAARNLGSDGHRYAVRLSRALLPVHAFFILQLIPLPAFVLRAVSPGSFAAHFLPDTGDGRFRPLTVSAGATIEAWLYVAGLHGLAMTLAAIPREKRRQAVELLLVALVLLATEGLWQSRASHPFWLYAWVPIVAPPGLETSTFGPYYNRNHFATLMAVGAALAAGLASAEAGRAGSRLQAVLSDGRVLAQVVWLLGAGGVLSLAGVASGSRSGVLAGLAGIGIVVGRALGFRYMAASLALLVLPLVLSGGAAMERFARLDIVQSRWAPWTDMATLLRFFPVFGSGFGTFVLAYLPYQRNATYEIWPHAHNEYLQCVIEGGLAGVVALAVAWKRIRRALVLDPALGEAAVGVAVAFAAQALLDFPARIPANAAVVTALLILSQRTRHL